MPASKIVKHTSSIIKAYLEGSDTIELGTQYNVTHGAVRALLKRNGVPLRDRSFSARKYTWDDSVFDLIDTPEKAYVLGFFYADGCNHQSTSRWLISVVDLEILEKIKIVLGSNYKIEESHRTRKSHIVGKKVKSYKQAYTLRISSPHLCERMTALGAPPKKTGITRWPTPEQVPPGLIRHFLRGLMDGDGYITVGTAKKGNNPTIAVGWCADEHLAKGLADWLESELGIHGTLRDKGSIREVVVAGRHQARYLLDKLYEGSTIHMSRKRAKFDEFLGRLNN